MLLHGACGIIGSVEALIVVDNRVRVCTDGMAESLVRELREPFAHANAQHAMKKRLGIPAWDEPPVIRTWTEEAPEVVSRETETWLSLPRGGLARVRAVLASNGWTWRLEDRRERGTPTTEIPETLVKLYPHQEQIVEMCVSREQCLVRSGTGSGKTSALLALAGRLKVPTLVVLPSVALMDQWLERAARDLGMDVRDVGIIRGKRCELRPLTLAIWKSLENGLARKSGEKIRRYFGAVFMDEVQTAAAKSFFASIDPMPARYRIGTSADERRKDRKEFLIHDLFGEVAVDVPRSELVAAGRVLDVEVRVIPTQFRADWYGIADEQNTEKSINFVRLVKEMAAAPGRNEVVLEVVRREVEEGQQVLVMVHEREHCAAIGTMLVGDGIRNGYLIGGDDFSTEFRQTLGSIRSGELPVGIGTYKAIGTGIDLPAVGVAVGVTPLMGNEQFFGQVRGRLCRTSEGKTTARLYLLWDRFVYPRHIENVSRWNSNTVVWSDDKWVPAKQFIRENMR